MNHISVVSSSEQVVNPKAGSPARTFEPPEPGSWSLGAQHFERPLSRWLSEALPEPYIRGFRDAFEANGALLDTIQIAFINGFGYTCVRPLGAPKDAKGPPPKAIFKLLCWLHPGIRRRVRVADETFASRRWREEAASFYREREEVLGRHAELQEVNPRSLTDGELAVHVSACRDAYQAATYRHHRLVCAVMLPIGDFIAQAAGWTGVEAARLLDLMRGASAGSRGAEAEVARIVTALSGDAEQRARLTSDAPPAEIIASLRQASGELGDAVRDWLERFGLRVFTGFDVADLSAIEVPEVLVKILRSGLEGSSLAQADAVDRRTAEVRSRVPEQHRAAFDELLEEARRHYRLRDDRNHGNDDWAAGLARRALLEAGRRFAASGALLAQDHVFDLLHDEILALLDGRAGPSAEEVAAIVAYRRTATSRDAPDVLGLPASPPPPAEWFSGGTARSLRAIGAYIGAMFDERADRPDPTVVRGLSASGGRYVGTARVVLSPTEFARVQRGDVLIARMTVPTYNVLLPLIGGVVTDRGGLLSHPAIVAREYGIPGVVGCRDATVRIPDGATVEIDGTAGTVRVLS